MAKKTVRKVSNSNGHSPALNRMHERLLEMATNIYSSRWGYLEAMMDPRRNIDQECGYSEINEHDPHEYRRLFDRDPIASRVVKLMPMECWGLPPEIYESEDPKTHTPFEEAWIELGASLGGDNWHEDLEGTVIWELLRRADMLAGIGHFGVILLGFDDTPNLNEPVEGIDEFGVSSIAVRKKSGAVANAKTTRKLLYLRAFDETQVQISRLEDNIRNPRYGQPVEYQINFNDIENQATGQAVVSIGTKTVHWTRVIHIADNILSSELIGVPRCKPVLHRILDLRKLYGGSAEMFWKGAFPGLSIETQPQLQGDVDIDVEGMRQQMFDYMNSLQRYLTLTGMTAKTLAPSVTDPTAQINVELEAICIELGVPIRIFKGSERGELASSQDAAAWIDRLKDRQRMVLTPRLIVPFINRLIQVGCLPMPKRYVSKWPDLAALSEEEQARVGTLIVDVMVKYIQGGLEVLMTPMDFLMRILHYSQDEAEGILEAAMEAAEAESTLTLPPEPPEGPVGPDGQPLPVGPDGKPVGPDGEPVELGPDGQPLEEVDEDGEPIEEDEEEQPVPAFGKKPKPPQFARNELVDNADDCDWITVSGTHVCVKGGEVAKGPAGLSKTLETGPKSGNRKTVSDAASRKRGFKNAKDEEAFEKASRLQDRKEAKSTPSTENPKLKEMRSQFDAMKKQLEGIKGGLVHKDGDKVTRKGASHIAKKVGGWAKTLPDLIGTKLLGKEDFEAIKGIPADLKSRFRNLFKKGRFTANEMISISPATLEGLVELGLVYNAFCPTGPGGGQDNSCSPKSGGGSYKELSKEADIHTKAANEVAHRLEMRYKGDPTKATTAELMKAVDLHHQAAEAHALAYKHKNASGKGLEKHERERDHHEKEAETYRKWAKKASERERGQRANEPDEPKVTRVGRSQSLGNPSDDEYDVSVKPDVAEKFADDVAEKYGIKATLGPEHSELGTTIRFHGISQEDAKAIRGQAREHMTKTGREMSDLWTRNGWVGNTFGPEK